MTEAQRFMPKYSGVLILIIINFILTGSLFCQSSSDDVVHLKNGGMVRGTIFEQVPNSYIKIKTLEGKVKTYKMSEVSKVTKAEGKDVQKSPMQQPEVQPKVLEQKHEVKSDKSNKPKDDVIEPVKNAGVSQRKSPTTAFVLSVLVPGGGQYYNGEYGKGAIMTGVAAAGVVLIFAAGYEDVFVKDDYYWASYGYWTTESTPWLSVGIGMIVVSSVWSMIDAPLSARKINQSAVLSENPYLFKYKSDKYLLGCDIVPARTGWKLNATLIF
ncbi:MAG: hypothetical protein HY964_10215 [Ignavibacteriales bacterium]|nr:hypothetical protein [Ignavibacteriales bacterium]